ncbi:hypothetical protein ACLB2K_071098 [Fragaria x ananassa]
MKEASGRRRLALILNLEECSSRQYLTKTDVGARDSQLVTNNSTACGFIIRDDNGRPVSVVSCRIRSVLIPIAEVMTSRDSLIKAKEKDFTNVEVGGDSKLVIDAANVHLEPP